MSVFSQRPEASPIKDIEYDTLHFSCNMCGNCCRGRDSIDDSTGIFLSGPDVRRMLGALKHDRLEELIDKYITITYDEEKVLMFASSK